MKKSILALCALTVAGLSACGGGTSSHTIGGTITGLQYPGLVLQNNLSNDLTVAAPSKDAAGNIPAVINYSFPKQVDYGDPYSVTIKTQPQHQICVPTSGTADTAGRLSSINAEIFCSLATHKIGGKVSGLGTGTLVLTNGSTGGTLSLTNSTGTTDPIVFTFGSEVTYKDTYGVTVLTNPANQTCRVVNGAGEMGDNDITNIEVTCVNNPQP